MQYLKNISITLLLCTLLWSSNTVSYEMQNVMHACDNNISSACFELGELYREGFGVDANLSKAKQYYRKACDLGFDEGCKTLNRLNIKGN